jgi:hypothetical protein
VSRPRSLVLLLTIIALIYMAANQPKRVEVVEVKYCRVTYWRWAEIDGREVKLWYPSYGPCSLVDQYEEA